MKLLQDFQGLQIRLTNERLAHILEHPEMAAMESAIEETLRQPAAVIQSLSDPQARLYYRFYLGTMVGDKYLCVVVKIAGDDAFVSDGVSYRRRQEGSPSVAEKRVKIWYDPEGDHQEVIFDQRPGYFRETVDDRVMEKVDDEGNVLGFSVLRVSAVKEAPLEVAL